MFLFAEESYINWLMDPHSNVLNYIILVVALCWGWSKYAKPAFDSRKEQIETSIKAAQQAKQESQAFLTEQRAKVAEAQKDVDNIVKEARQVAEQMKQQIEEDSKKELADLAAKVEAAIANERQVVITEMRAQAVKAAITLCEEQLSRSVSESVKARLLTQFMEQLDTVTSSGEKMSAGQFESIR